MDIVNTLFGLCVSFLTALGELTHLTYKQISVVFNLYLQGAVLAVSGCLPLIALIRNPQSHATLIALAYAALYVAGFVWLLWHYGGPMDIAFDRCVDDLIYVAHRWRMSYNAVNIIIFVIFWLALTIFNILVFIRLLRH